MDFTTSQSIAVAWEGRRVVPAGKYRLKTLERVICGPGDKIGGQKNHEVRAGLRAPWETIATKTARAIRWRNLWRWRLWSSYNALRDDGGRWPRKSAVGWAATDLRWRAGRHYYCVHRLTKTVRADKGDRRERWPAGWW